MYQRGAGDQRDRLHAGVDEVWVDVGLVRRRADADDAVLGVEDDLSVGDEVGNFRRDANAQVDEPAFGDVVGDAAGDAVSIEGSEFGVGHEAGPYTGTCSTRCTKTP